MKTTPIFITGIGTDVGKTVVAAIVTEALHADYWKPVQAGFDSGTDALSVRQLISNDHSVIHPEAYKLRLPASPHISAREESLQIDINIIKKKYDQLLKNSSFMIIEGAGGIMVPLNENEFVIDLIQTLQAKVILVSRNYLGSINHSLLTAAMCKQYKVNVAGWIFNDHYMNYETEIAQWSGFNIIATVPRAETVSKEFISKQAEKLRHSLKHIL